MLVVLDGFGIGEGGPSDATAVASAFFGASAMSGNAVLASNKVSSQATAFIEFTRAQGTVDAGGSELMGKQNFVVAYYQAIGKCSETQPDDPTVDVDWFRLKDDEARDLRKLQYEWRDKFLVEINTIACNLTTPAWEKANAGWKTFNEEFKQ